MKYAGILRAATLAAILLSAGCVERKLTIVTQPEDATVWLNDEEIGTTPVTVSFNWYGDYRVRIEKPGYAIINTHKNLKQPLHDKFPIDFFAQHIWPGRIIDTYTWNYELALYQAPSSEELVGAANAAKAGFQKEIDDAQLQIQKEQGTKKK
jgi:hypothetical protein